jgi:protein-disulfide isomerase
MPDPEDRLASDTPDASSERRRSMTALAQAQDAHQTRLQRLLMGFGFVVVIGAVIAGVIIFQGGAGGTARIAPPLKVSEVGHGLALGKPSAPVHVVVYEDFRCPSCRQFEEGSRDYLRADAAGDKAYVEYRPVAVLGQYSTRALNAFVTVLDTAGPDVARRFHDLLFDRQPARSGPGLTNAQLVTLAVAAGARRGEVQGAIDSLAHKDWIASANADARKAGVRAILTVLVDGRPLQGSSIQQTVDTLETRIARKG